MSPLLTGLLTGPVKAPPVDPVPTIHVSPAPERFTSDYLSEPSNFVVISETPIPTATPTPTPTPKPLPLTSADLEKWFSEISSQQSIDKDLLKRIAYCESNLNPRAINGDYLGLYQFSKSTWEVTRRRMNHDPNPSLRMDALESIRTAAFKIATDGRHAWPACSI